MMLPIFTYGQKYVIYENKDLGEKIIRHYDRTTGIITQKEYRTVHDSQYIKYYLGLVVYTQGRSSEDFMDDEAYLFFDDKTTLKVTGSFYVNYFQEGKHQYSIKHEITDDEMKILQSKIIVKICIAHNCRDIDKWEGPAEIKIFNDIINQ